MSSPALCLTSLSRPLHLADTVAHLAASVEQEWNVAAECPPLLDAQAEILDVMVRLLELAVEHSPDLTMDRREISRAAAVLVRWHASEGDSADVVLARCRARIAFDASRLVWQDPFSLRHVLTAGQPSSEVEAILPDLAIAVARNDAAAVHAGFVRLGRLGSAIGSLGPVRALFQECAREGLPGLWPFAFELAVLEDRLHAEPGWERARGFVALMAQLEPPCTAAIRDYLNLAEIESTLRVVRRHDDRIAAWHFDLLRRTWTSDALTHLRKLVRMRASIPLAPEVGEQTEVEIARDSAATVEVRPWRDFWRRLVSRRSSGPLVLAGA